MAELLKMQGVPESGLLPVEQAKNTLEKSFYVALIINESGDI